MTLPTATVVATAARNLALVALEDRTVPGSRALYDAVNDVLSKAARVSSNYGPLKLPRELFTGLDGANSLAQVNMTDTQYADVAALKVAAALAVGDSLVLVLATNDLTDNALATAKGSGTAVGDVYLLITATTVLYLGTVPALVS